MAAFRSSPIHRWLALRLSGFNLTEFLGGLTWLYVFSLSNMCRSPGVLLAAVGNPYALLGFALFAFAPQRRQVSANHRTLPFSANHITYTENP
jgi:hypothetical protein